MCDRCEVDAWRWESISYLGTDIMFQTGAQPKDNTSSRSPCGHNDMTLASITYSCQSLILHGYASTYDRATYDISSLIHIIGVQQSVDLEF